MRKKIGVMLPVIVMLLFGSVPFNAPAEEAMTIRFYVLPIERDGTGILRWPKYFASRFNGGVGITADRNLIDYGLIDEGVLVANLGDADQAFLAAQPDVFAFPVDLDATMSQSEQITLTNLLETAQVPAQWLSGQQTYRSVLRTLTGMFLYMQRVSAILGVDPTTLGVALNTQWRNLPPALQTALQQAAVDLGYDFGGVNNNTTLRNVLKAMADQWGTRPIYLGMATL